MPPKFFLIVRLKAYLEALLGCPVDIIRKHQHLNPFLLKEIEREMGLK
jgi:predicted nucleotidyltransferase